MGLKKCTNCKGTGNVRSQKRTVDKESGKVTLGKERVGECAYCRGKGFRRSKYGADER